jgi:hypothetical protein
MWLWNPRNFRLRKADMSGIDPRRPPLPERAFARMTARQYAAALKKLGLSQVRAARFFGLSDRQGHRLANARSSCRRRSHAS